MCVASCVQSVAGCFADQHVVLTHPAAAVRWAHCFTLVKCIDVRCNKYLNFLQLAPHISRVQRLKIGIQRSVYMTTPFSRALSRFSESFQKLTHIKLVVRLPNDEDQKDDNSGETSIFPNAFDDTAFILAFSRHLAHITSLRFVNTYGYDSQVLQVCVKLATHLPSSFGRTRKLSFALCLPYLLSHLFAGPHASNSLSSHHFSCMPKAPRFPYGARNWV